jgi:hypothetical protein
MASVSNPFSATGIELTGMVPYSEQVDSRFRVGGDHASVWVPHDFGSNYRYGGVLIGEFGTQTTATLKAEWLNNGGSTKITTLKLTSASSWAGTITDVSMGTASGKRVFTIKGDAPAAGHQVIVAPYAYKMPAFSDQAAYTDAGGWVPFSGSGAKEDVSVTVSTVTQYAIFVGKGFPSQLEVVSEVWIYTV